MAPASVNHDGRDGGRDGGRDRGGNRGGTVRSWLYVPGDRPELAAKAVASGAGALILDLEDGVAASAKARARAEVAALLRAPRGLPTWVRIDPDVLDDDLAVAVEGGADGIVVAKATLDTVREVAARLPIGGPPLAALIESARGVLDAAALAELDAVARLALGEADLRADLGLDPGPDETELAPYRALVVAAAAAAGLARPTGPAGTDFRDLDRFRATCERLRRQGFGGRSAVHPAQVPVIEDVFAPGADAVAAAEALVAEFDRGVAAGDGVQIGGDGTMLDEAVVRAARRLLDER